LIANSRHPGSTKKFAKRRGACRFSYPNADFLTNRPFAPFFLTKAAQNPQNPVVPQIFLSAHRFPYDLASFLRFSYAARGLLVGRLNAWASCGLTKTKAKPYASPVIASARRLRAAKL
jgi:hypothetical protein